MWAWTHSPDRGFTVPPAPDRCTDAEGHLVKYMIEVSMSTMCCFTSHFSPTVRSLSTIARIPPNECGFMVSTYSIDKCSCH